VLELLAYMLCFARCRWGEVHEVEESALPDFFGAAP
jgi:hypothetical protein